jgi:hypothetical protein
LELSEKQNERSREVMVMAKLANRKIKSTETAASDGGSMAPGPNGSALLADADIARRAYDLYLARGCEPGHDVEDWLQAERDLRGAVSVLAQDPRGA